MGIILLDREDSCMCDCSTKCILGKTGSSARCTKKDLEKEGYTAMNLKEVKEKRSWLFEKEKPKRVRMFSQRRKDG